MPWAIKRYRGFYLYVESKNQKLTSKTKKRLQRQREQKRGGRVHKMGEDGQNVHISRDT